jgi:signal transduction histidine kinase
MKTSPYENYAAALAEEQAAWKALGGRRPGAADFEAHAWQGWRDAVRRSTEARLALLPTLGVDVLAEHSRVESELTRNRALLEAAQAIAGLVSVQVDPASGRIAEIAGDVRIVGHHRLPHDVVQLTASFAPPSRQALLGLLRAGGVPGELELQVGTGSFARWVRVVRGEDTPDAQPLATVVFQDVTAIKRARDDVLRMNDELEARVERRTRQLKGANRELEAFSYSVSHDLKAPLAAIEGFTHVLGERLRGRIDARETGMLQRVRAGVAQMYALIDALLALHNVARTSRLQWQCVDVTAAAGTIVRELREQAPDRPCEARIAPGMVIRCDEALLTLALRNVIGNAWKFSAGKPRVQLDIALDPEGPPGHASLRIRDGGAGFDPALAHKLFAPFQRLHHAQDFPGTGIGLATVQRILQRHGGSVRADATPGQGATFWLHFPDLPMDTES